MLFVAIVFVFISGCVTTDGYYLDSEYSYSNNGVRMVITNPYNYYYYDNGRIYHYNHYAPQRVVVIGRPPMGATIHHYRIPSSYYSGGYRHPPTNIIQSPQRRLTPYYSRPHPGPSLPRPPQIQHRPAPPSQPPQIQHRAPMPTPRISAPPRSPRFTPQARPAPQPSPSSRGNLPRSSGGGISGGRSLRRR